jgi:hypothetical protein
MKPKVALVLAIVLFAAASPTFAFPFLGLQADELDVNANLMLIGSTPPAGHGQGNTLVQLIGVSLPMKLAAPFFVEPDIELWGWPYSWTGSAAVPTASEDGTGFWTLGILLGLQGGASWDLSPAVALGGTIGLDVLLRFPIELQNTGQTVMADELSALGYYYGALRFLYPETRFFVRWRVSQPIELLFNLRAWYPVFHLWDGEGLSFWDQMMISAGIGIAIKLGQPAAPASAPAEQPAEAPAETPTASVK